MAKQRYTRERNKRELHKTLYIFTEGEKTEVNYFEAKAREINSRERYKRRKLRIEVIGTGRNTLSLVDKALEYIENNGVDCNLDECWVVFDLDDFNRDFDNAINKAEANKIKVAYSIASFELWYLLHFKPHNTAWHRKIYGKTLTECLKNHTGDSEYKYEKNSEDMYELLKEKESEAIRNAERLIKDNLNVRPISKKDPSTTVHLLVKRINEIGNNQ